ncbi:MAG: MBL fold metallo-hydrolase [Rhodocyclaceae bacterium]|nr:MBL fold metallo-hydrolase [Rhodocyclaceae bacterium]
MKVRFWGTRGSIPVSITAPQVRAKIVAALAGARDRATAGAPLDTDAAIADYVDALGFDVSGTFGGHSSCVEVDTGGEEPVILDMGSGARPLAGDFLRRFGPGSPRTYHVFMSHLHWDHIMGFPFFTPVYIPGNRIVVHSCHAEVEHAFRRQQAAPSFPVEFDQLAARIEFDVLEPGRDYRIAGLTVRAKKQLHAGDSYGWRLGDGGRTLVYSTDSEHKLDRPEERQGFIEFFRDADLVVFDAMYSLADAISVKADWGHSSNIVGVELCQLAGARRLCLYHHEPAYDDTQIARVLAETRRYEEITRAGPPLVVDAAWDGLEIAL